MRVLIIGGTGLISTAITRALIARGDDVTLYNRGQTEADIPQGYSIILGNRKDTAAKADLNFRYTIPFVEGVRRIVDWLDVRGRIHDEDEPEIYDKIIERWRYLSTKETFFGETDSAKA